MSYIYWQIQSQSISYQTIHKKICNSLGYLTYLSNLICRWQWRYSFMIPSDLTWATIHAPQSEPSYLVPYLPYLITSDIYYPYLIFTLSLSYLISFILSSPPYLTLNLTFPMLFYPILSSLLHSLLQTYLIFTSFNSIHFVSCYFLCIHRIVHLTLTHCII